MPHGTGSENSDASLRFRGASRARAPDSPDSHFGDALDQPRKGGVIIPAASHARLHALSPSLASVRAKGAADWQPPTRPAETRRRYPDCAAGCRRENIKSTTWLTAAKLRAILGMRIAGSNPSFGTVGGYEGLRRGQIAYLQQEEIACVNT
jgi:hypothetical protein